MSRRPVSRKPISPRPRKGSPQRRSNGFGTRFFAKITRDLVMFSVGLVLVINEAAIRHGEPREVLIILYAAMMGLPLVFQGDEWRRRRNGKDDWDNKDGL